MKIILMIFYFFCLINVTLCQVQKSKKREKILTSIYSTVMNDFCKDKTWAFVMDDSTRNREIYNWDYVRYSENLFNYDRSGNPVKFLLDSSWLPFLKNVNTKMRMLKKTRIPEFKSIAKVHILNKDTISSLKEQFTVGSGFYKNIGWMKGRLEFSDIILSDKKNM